MITLPDYFLADLPPEATISPALLGEACLTLKRNREQYLASRTTEQIIKILSHVAEGWLQPDSPFRELALADGPRCTGFGRATLERGLDSFFAKLTRESLRAWLAQELGDARRLGEFALAPGEEKFSRAAIATGPEFLLHICAGNLPNPTWTSMVLGLLTRSAQFVKCATGASFLPRLFAHSIYDADHKLGACLEVAEWPGGHAALEETLFAEADCVTATGSDETLAAIRAKLPVQKRFLGYGHRVSFGYVTGESLSGFGGKRLVKAAASDVVAWNQLGCLSPHVLYVQRGGETGPETFAQLLAEEMAQREQTEPRGAVPPDVAAAIASRRGIYEVRAAHGPDTLLWRSQDSTAWTVVFEADPRFAMSCLHRFIYVKAVADLAEVLHAADAVRSRVSTVGIAADEEEAKALATTLARWGVTRICPLGQMQNPPLTWRHDGRPALGDLVRWTDFEGSQ
jgi:hypothetical protein